MDSVRHQVILASRRLRAAGVPAEEADLDARLLAREVLGWDAAQYLTSSNDTTAPGFGERFDVLIARREVREPMAYILGRQEFWGRDFAVTPAVLIPRPETEIVIETALDLFRDRQATLSIADVGTGSGCLAVTLAAQFPRAHVIATDRSSAALAVARQNARLFGVANRITFVDADLMGQAGVHGLFDLVVSNPPYIPEPDRQGLQPEVVGHEPSAALFAGADGLAVIGRLLSEAGRWLTPSGLLLVEFGAGQADRVAELISAAPGLTMVDLKRDLQGIPRTAVARATAPV